MAAPTITVVFKDADGDEFPIAVGDVGQTIGAAQEEALTRIEQLVSEGTYRPRGMLVYDRTEGR